MAAQNVAQRSAGFGSTSDFEALSATTSTALSLTVPAGAKSALVTVDAASARWRSDGTSPTSTVGMFLADGGAIEVFGEDLDAFEIIGASGTATVSVTYFA